MFKKKAESNGTKHNFISENKVYCSSLANTETICESEDHEKSSFQIDKAPYMSEEMNPLHYQVKHLQRLLVEEQDKFTGLQKRLHDSESQRLNLIRFVRINKSIT